MNAGLRGRRTLNMSGLSGLLLFAAIWAGRAGLIVVILAGLLFCGQPDLHDALIARVQPHNCVSSN